MKHIFIFFLLTCIHSTSATLSAQVHERWDVKTLTDNPHLKKTITQASASTIGKPQLTKVGNITPRMDFERKIVRIKGKVYDIKHQDNDGDYHIEVRTGHGDSTVVCEAVDPSNTATSHSPAIEKFRVVFAKAEQLKKGDAVIITGVIFQDKKHGKPSKFRTRNFIEIHPILTIE